MACSRYEVIGASPRDPRISSCGKVEVSSGTHPDGGSKPSVGSPKIATSRSWAASRSLSLLRSPTADPSLKSAPNGRVVVGHRIYTDIHCTLLQPLLILN